MPFDYKKEYKEFYMPPKIILRFVGKEILMMKKESMHKRLVYYMELLLLLK